MQAQSHSTGTVCATQWRRSCALHNAGGTKELAADTTLTIYQQLLYVNATASPCNLSCPSVLLQVLLRRTKHNPLLIGEAGVGKTAIVEGIAQLMAAQHPPPG